MQERRDYIEYRDAKISFLRGAFGQVDDIKGEVVRTVPYFADQPLSNGEELRGRIAMVLVVPQTANHLGMSWSTLVLHLPPARWV